MSSLPGGLPLSVAHGPWPERPIPGRPGLAGPGCSGRTGLDVPVACGYLCTVVPASKTSADTFFFFFLFLALAPPLAAVAKSASSRPPFHELELVTISLILIIGN